MKRVAWGALAFIGVMCSEAWAADLPPAPGQMSPVRAPASLPFNWGGLYAGLNGGGSLGDVDGFLVGGQIGYNWQIGQVVFGVESDLQWTDMDATSTRSIGGTTLGDKQELDWLGTLRGRLGYALWDRWLPYVTGGLAYGTRKASGFATGLPGGSYNATNTGIGWAAGFGLDYAFDPWWSARVEYLHVSLDGFAPTYVLIGGPLTVPYGRLDNDIIRGAFNYRIAP